MKILNLDSFVSVQRRVTLKGKSYDVRQLSVQQFIDSLDAAEKAEAEGADTTKPEDMRLSAQLKLMIPAIQQGIPDLPAKVIGDLPIEAMTQLLAFVRGELDDGANSTSTTTDEDAGGDEAKKD